MDMDNVAIDLDEESKEFQKFPLTDPPRPQDRMNIDGVKPLEHKSLGAGDFLYHVITKCLAPDTYSPYLAYLKNRTKVVLVLDEKPDKNSPTPSAYSPSNPPDWAHKWEFKLPKTYEEYVRLKSSQVPSFISSFISDEYQDELYK